MESGDGTASISEWTLVQTQAASAKNEASMLGDDEKTNVVRDSMNHDDICPSR